MSVSPVPEGVHTITPNIIAADARSLIAFLREAFSAEELARLVLPDGKIVHCELRIGDSRINLGQAMEGFPAHALMAQLYVADSDEVFAAALRAGATQVMPMTNMFFGSREGRVTDPFGNTWTIASRKELVSYEEMQRRLDQQAG
jgi:PhnB protein